MKKYIDVDVEHECEEGKKSKGSGGSSGQLSTLCSIIRESGNMTSYSIHVTCWLNIVKFIAIISMIV